MGPTPRGRSYALNTAPGKIIAGTMVWEASFEFLGLGETTQASRARLYAALPEILTMVDPGSIGCDSPAGSAGDVRDHSPWPEMLPPTVGDQSQVESVSQVFSHHLVPWLDESVEHPHCHSPSQRGK